MRTACVLLLALTLAAPVRSEAQSILPVSYSRSALQPQPESPSLFEREIWDNRHDFITGVENNIRFLDSPEGEESYQQTTGLKIDRGLVRASLVRFRALLLTSDTPEEFRRSLNREFKLYRSVGMDGDGTVKFTGYYQPSYRASRSRSEEFPYPIYSAPENFESWSLPHPTRVELEGYYGKGSPTSPLQGREIAWLKNRYEAFMIHVQGSALLDFTDGTQSSVGFVAGTEYPFRGISQTFLDQHHVAWGNLSSFFSTRPELLDQLLARNNRFILFRVQQSPEAIGSLGVPVMPERSIATDKTLLPPGALALIQTSMPGRGADGSLRLMHSTRFVLDQDKGSAIRGPGRVDVFMGSGEDARRMANMMYSHGELYYFLLNDTDRRV